jgi:SAM-dependent methyltransferase
MMYILETRDGLLKFLPKGGVGAEIGVAHGDYSELILRIVEPRELHLIDPWSSLEDGSDLLSSATMLSDVTQKIAAGSVIFGPPPRNEGGERHLLATMERLGSFEQVHFHRQYSYKAVEKFPDQYFDFVYVDGNHNYEVALRDLHDYSRKLKPGGLLFGHDFFEDAFAKENNYGVINAVHSFVKRTDFQMFMLSWEPFSTFFLANNFTGFAGQFLHNCFESEVHMIEIPNSIAFNFKDKSYPRKSGNPRRIPSFG